MPVASPQKGGKKANMEMDSPTLGEMANDEMEEEAKYEEPEPVHH